MKKPVTVALLFTFVFSILTPTFGQKAEVDSIGKTSIRTQFGLVRAVTDGSGVAIRWEMKRETGIAAYNVYRVENHGRELVNAKMLPSSASRLDGKVTYGESYQIFDPNGVAGMAYVVEGYDVHGGRLSSKEVGAISVADLATEIGTSSETFIRATASKNSDIEHRSSALNAELNDIVSLNEQTPDPVNQIWVASQPGAKIAVKKDGFYRVSASQLISANFPVNTDSSKWRLFLDGVEQSIIVGSGGLYIEFYGKGIDTAETDTRTYYLINGSVPGKRIGNRTMRPIAGSAASSRYPVVVRKKERISFNDELFNGDGENFLGSLFTDTATEVSFTLTGIDTTVPNSEITINLYGFTNNHHEVRPRINGNDLPLITQDGPVFYTSTVTVPTSHLIEGVNRLQLTSYSPADYNQFDNLEVKYARKYQADDNRISFFTPGYRKVDVSGFSTANVRVFDLTFDGTPTLISNVPVVSGETGFTAKIPSSRTMVAYAVEDTALLQSPGITENFPSTISASTNAADMLIITHSAPSFKNAAEVWATYRRSVAGGSFNVKVIDIADVFDEFSYGVFGAAAIKAFLEHTDTGWQTTPKYVLFMGDSSYDPRNYEGWGNFDLIPSQSVTLILEESVSDEALGDFDDDGLSEIAIGRIPARSAATITIAYNKTVAFETAPQQTYSRGVLFAHDVFGGFDFESMSDQMKDELPQNTPVTLVSAGSPSGSTDLINAMNSGKLFVNYSGHGASGLWANSSFFNSNSVPQLTNLSKPSVYSMLTCLNGYFIRPNGDALAEVLLNSPTGGAVAAWASTSETTPDIQLIMGLRFFDQASSGNLNRMGDLITDAKAAIPFGADVRLSWVLLGDPALKIP